MKSGIFSTAINSGDMKSIKALASDANVANLISSKYAYALTTNYEPTSFDLQDSIPTIDYSLLTSPNPDHRSKAVQELGKACEEWGFFMLVNHGVPETLTKKMMDKSDEFFSLPESEKLEYEGKGMLDPIRCSTSFHGADKGKVLLWRDYLKVISHPQFHFPNKPSGYKELAEDYATKTRMITKELLKGMMESLGLEESCMNKTLNLDSGLQLLVINYYPPCPQPETAIGIPPHTDHGLLTLLYQNGVGGLQVRHHGQWVHVNHDIPNAFLVNTGDHLEIFSNGKYKSVWHRAVLNEKVTRITLVTPFGPSLDTVVSPLSEFVDNEHPSAYLPMKYEDYINSMPKVAMDGVPILDRVRIPVKQEQT